MGNGAYTRDDRPDTERILGVVRKLEKCIFQNWNSVSWKCFVFTPKEKNGTKSERDRINIIERKVVVCGH